MYAKYTLFYNTSTLRLFLGTEIKGYIQHKKLFKTFEVSVNKLWSDFLNGQTKTLKQSLQQCHFYDHKGLYMVKLSFKMLIYFKANCERISRWADEKG